MKIGNSIQFKRIVTLYLMGFTLIFGYAFARPCIDSIFLEHYSNDDLPSAWLITSLVSVFVIIVYNRLNQHYAILSLFGGLSLVCAAMLAVLLGAYSIGFVPAIFILYIWKELYMVVLMETYWSFADIVFSISTARHTYGVAMTISSIGGILGNLAVGPAARLVGTRLALTMLLITLVLCFLIAYLGRKIADEKPNIKESPNVGVGLKTLFTSRYLVPLAILACTVQVVTGLIDYQFNGMLKEDIVNTDMRTESLGNIHASVNMIGVSFQVCMGIILRIFGIGTTFLAIPLMLSMAMFSFIALPHFAIIVLVKIVNKSLDYSLFRGVKEILYIPLSREEKTQGKGLIDIFMYRLARGLSSVLLLGMIALGLAPYVMEIAIALVILWVVLAAVVTRRYQSLLKNSDEVVRH